MSMPVSRNQRFKRGNTCPVCGGHSNLPPGQSKRCWGYISEDGRYCHCTREEYAGKLDKDPKTGAFVHLLKGKCNCGIEHGPADPPNILRIDAVKLDESGNRQRRKIEIEYNYYDPEGVYSHSTVRYNPKGFSQYHLDNEGNRVWNLEGVQTYLYKLPQLLSQPDKTVFIVEGEKDVETLVANGFTATCNPMGAGKWKPEYNQYLEGRDIVIVPDNDTPGQTHAETVFKSLLPKCKSIKVVKVAGGSKDITEWFNAGHDTQEFISLVNKVEAQLPPQPKKLFYNIDELDQIPPLQWLVKGLLYRNTLAMLAGPAGSKKTFYMLDVTLKIAMTEPVMYIAGEGASGIRRRIKGWKQKTGLDPKNFYLWPQTMGPHDPEKRTEFLDAVKDIKPVLIIIDTLARNSFGLEENSQKDMSYFLEGCDLIRLETGATVMIIHHSGWDASRERGSSTFRGNIDTVMLASEEGDLTKISCLKQKDEDEFEPIFIRWDRMTIGFDEDGKEITTLAPEYTTGEDIIQDQPKLSNNTRQVLEVFNSEQFRDSGAGWKTVLEALGWEDTKGRKAQVFKIISGLIGKKYLEKVSRGDYRITVKGKNILAPQMLNIDPVSNGSNFKVNPAKGNFEPVDEDDF